MDELHLNSQHDHVFREVSEMGFCETWLNDSVPDSEVAIDGFSLIRLDRTEKSGKEREKGGGGGACTLTIVGARISKYTRKCVPRMLNS